MRFEARRIVGVAVEIIAVGEAVAEQDVHDGAGERTVGAGPQDQLDVGLLHRRRIVDVDDDDLGAALLAGADRVGHHVDLRGDGVGAPDDDAVGLRHLARIGADAARPCRRNSRSRRDWCRSNRTGRNSAWRGAAGGCRRAARGPWCRRSNRARRSRSRVAASAVEELLGDQCRAHRPTRSPRQSPSPFAPLRGKRLQQPVRMVDALGIAGDLGADHAGRVAVVLGAAHAARCGRRRRFRHRARRSRGNRADRRNGRS